MAIQGINELDMSDVTTIDKADVFTVVRACLDLDSIVAKNVPFITRFVG